MPDVSHELWVGSPTEQSSHCLWDVYPRGGCVWTANKEYENAIAHSIFYNLTFLKKKKAKKLINKNKKDDLLLSIC